MSSPSSSRRTTKPSQHTSPQMKAALSESPPMMSHSLDGSIMSHQITERNASDIRESLSNSQHSETLKSESNPAVMTTSHPNLRLDGSLPHTHQSERNASRIGDPNLKSNDPPWTSRDEAVAKGPFANTLRGDRGQSPNRNNKMSQSHIQLFGEPTGGQSKDGRTFSPTSNDYGAHCAVHNNRGSSKPY